jgi:Ca2+-binding EF-hand superfamily protein
MKEQIMKRVDVNKDGAIDMDEFTLLFEEVTFKIDVTYRAKKKFTELDENDSGRLELLKLLIVTGTVLTETNST